MNKDMNFLVVDDDLLSLETVVGFLKSMGFQWIYVFPDGKSALDFMQGSQVDFIISDWEMPDMDGLALLKAVKNNPALAKIPFIMIASQMSNEKMKIADAKIEGVDAYLVKPFRKFTLMEKISDVLFERQWQSRHAALVVDDDPAVRDFEATSMRQLGFNPVYTAQDGAEGFKILESHASEISMVVCDWNMPQLSGIQLLRKVRSTSTMSKMPFIMATAQIPEERRKLEMAIESEVDHYLLKPFRFNDLKEKVELVLANAKAKAIPDHMLANARVALTHEDYAAAERLFKLVSEKNPNNSEAFLGLADTELAQGHAKNFENAIKYIQQAIQINPKWALPRIRLATAYESKMAHEKAIDCLKVAAKECHPSADLYLHLGRLLYKRGRIEPGLKELKRALELDPAHKETLDFVSGLNLKGKLK